VIGNYEIAGFQLTSYSPLKTPLKTLVVIHPDQTYLDDVRSLESYITSELNVRDLILSADEEKYGVQYKVTADWPVLGKKLKKDLIKVKNALPSITSVEVKKFVQEKQIVVGGITLIEEDLVVSRGLSDPDTLQDLETNTDNDVLTILDTALHKELQSEGLAREIVNRVQRLRKKAGLLPTDDIKMEYELLQDPIGLEQVFAEHANTFEKALRRPLDKATITEVGKVQAGEDLDKMILEEAQEVGEATFMLRFLKL